VSRRDDEDSEWAPPDQRGDVAIDDELEPGPGPGPGPRPPKTPLISSEKAALARLEDLSDLLDAEREKAVAMPESQTTGIERPGQGSALMRSNLVVAAGTTLSRITGLVRVMVLAAVIGKTALADAYLIGNETPNIVYELLLGGVLSATLVPMFTSFLDQEDSEAGKRATNVVITVVLAVLALLTAVAFVAAPAIFGLYTINTEAGVDAALLQRVGTLLTRVFLIQIFFYGATGLANAYLNAKRRFFAAAWSPVLANLVVIATLLSLPDAPSDQGWQLGDVISDDRLRWTLGLGTTAGIAAMAIALVPAVRAAGLDFRPAFQLGHPAIRQLLTMSMWTLGYVVANQLVVVVIRNLSGPGTGDSAAYFQAFTFFVLPHGLLAMSIATTFVPEMARSVGRRDRAAFNARASLGVRMIALLTLPAGVALFVLRRPLIGLLLQRGEFSATDALITSRALAGFALGLVGFSVYLFALRGFYAHRDTRTPFIINVGQCLLNVVLALLFVGEWGVLGLGAAFALSYVACAVWALLILSYKVPGFPFRAVLEAIARMVLAGALAGEAMWLAADNVGGNTGVDALARLVAGGVAGGVTYVVVLILMGASELNGARARLG
jgi:putative peptidoglycan lipid II flippase